MGFVGALLRFLRDCGRRLNATQFSSRRLLQTRSRTVACSQGLGTSSVSRQDGPLQRSKLPPHRKFPAHTPLTSVMGCGPSIASLPATVSTAALPGTVRASSSSANASSVSDSSEPGKFSAAPVPVQRQHQISEKQEATRPALEVTLSSAAECTSGTTSTDAALSSAANGPMWSGPTDGSSRRTAFAALSGVPQPSCSTASPQATVTLTSDSVALDRLLTELELQLLPLHMLRELGKTKLGWAKASTVPVANVQRCLRSGARVRDLSPDMLRACGLSNTCSAAFLISPSHAVRAQPADIECAGSPPSAPLPPSVPSIEPSDIVPGSLEAVVVPEGDCSAAGSGAGAPAGCATGSDFDVGAPRENGGGRGLRSLSSTEDAAEAPGCDGPREPRSPEAGRTPARDRARKGHPLSVHERLLETVRRPVSGKAEAVLTFRDGRDLYTGAELRKLVGARAAVVAAGGNHMRMAGSAAAAAGVAIWDCNPRSPVRFIGDASGTSADPVSSVSTAASLAGGACDVLIHVDHILEVQAVVRAIEDTPGLLSVSSSGDDEASGLCTGSSALNLSTAFFDPIRCVVNDLHNLNVTEGAINMKKGRAFQVFLQRYGTASQLALGPCLLNDLQGRERMVLRTAKAIAVAIGDASPHVVEGLRETSAVYVPAVSQPAPILTAATLSHASRYRDIADRLDDIVAAMDVEGDRAASMEERLRYPRR